MGNMLSIKKVVILGATGALGEALVPALVQADFKVTCISRPGSRGTNFPGVKIKTADYTDVASLTAAFKDHDVVVEAFNPAAATHQTHILKAVVAAGVRHIITPDFSGNTFHPNAKEVKIFDPKLAAQRELERVVAESQGELTWTAIVSGPWYDWTIEKGIFWVNKEKRTITRYGSGDQKYSISRHALNGDALVAVLRDPERYRNRPAYFASHTVSTNQLISIIDEMRLTGWRVVDVPFDELADKAHAMWQNDTEKRVEDRLNSRAYEALATVALLDEKNRYGSNFEDKVEPGWDEGEEALAESLKRLLG
ncbi:nad -binding protein [Colletotrichum incanum]|uniref:Nad-binding protein n=1 Tax=Colletotrichum incanum TaxID=1573173 RepID=A0A161YBV0_COLIC|nr:nad -binding protein [Colletotrichum incanum]